DMPRGCTDNTVRGRTAAARGSTRPQPARSGGLDIGRGANLDQTLGKVSHRESCRCKARAQSRLTMASAFGTVAMSDAWPRKLLLLHNRYKERGGEDVVFETEVAML